ncbi:MAG: phospholipase D-like domain-containing protein [Actinomycetota bacterium]|nr:phospholipase D-like domain-containing protein [Actinomycetota bacterium]
MRAARLAIVVATLSLLAPLAVVGSATAGAVGTVSVEVSAPAAAADEKKAPSGTRNDRGSSWTPPTGVVLSDPMIPRVNRNILRRVIRAINNTAKREYIRVVVWNYDDRPVTNALLDADRRGVHVQIVVAGSVDNANWNRTRAQLNRKTTDKSFALKCTGGCRSRTKIMHSKYILFSRIHKAKNISMFGSFNLTTPAGNRQWNDMVTTRNFGLYQALEDTFNEYAKDIIVPAPYKVTDLGKYQVTLFPAFNRNPILAELNKVSCAGAEGNAGNAKGRTMIRIAIAGWFDAFGNDIARRVRTLWERGCDIRIITTLAGRGVNQTLKNPAGRGRVPIRQVTYDPNLDGIPERYLHMKNIAISGVYGGDKSAHVLVTGSPNWSTRAQKSDEILFRITKATKMVNQYMANTDRLFFSEWSHLRTAPSTKMLMRGVTEPGGLPNLRTGENVPDWFELN